MKKTISILLSFIIILSVFTACSKGESSNQNDNSADNISKQINFTIDSHYENIDESAVRAYEKICTAVVNGDAEVKLNTNLLDSVYDLFYTSFPLFSLVDTIQILPDTSGVALTYKNSPEEHMALVSQFLDKISEIMEQCQYGDVSTDRYIFNVYTYITTVFTIDSSVITVVDSLNDNKGYPAVLCSLFEYLVLQGGGKASHIINTEKSSMISMAQFKGEWYYFNPAMDISVNQGKALTGFAMSSARAGNIEYSYTDNLPVTPVENTDFDKLKSSVSFEASDDKVNVLCGDNENIVLEFN